MRVGIFGGSFDPIHNGHIAAARRAQHVATLDLVVFVPAGIQPLKPQGAQATPAQRVQMIELAIADEAMFCCSTIEVDRAGPSYTIDTLRAFRQQYGNDLFFILGADALNELPRWHRATDVLALARLIVIGRPGFSPDVCGVEQKLAGMSQRIQLISGPSLALSSTKLRQQIAAGDPIATLVPPAVAAFIAAHALYCI